jgi:hypothetical protein
VCRVKLASLGILVLPVTFPEQRGGSPYRIIA